ncbi:MAG TPA: 6-phosphogluconolactonase [Novosphingobium sp.]
MSIEIIDHAANTAIAQWIADRLRVALERAGDAPVAITVPGGSTPFPIIAELAAYPLDWSRVVVWPGDDRIVEEASPASNVGRIRALLEPVGARIVPLAAGLVPPHFALAWLGMGGDGHVASLFPNTDPQIDAPRSVMRLTPDPLPPEAPFDRLSLTLPALLDSDALLFVIRGDDKRRLFEAAMVGANDLPVARLLGARTQPVTCFA